jgi:hypothetical protein
MAVSACLAYIALPIDAEARDQIAWLSLKKSRRGRGEERPADGGPRAVLPLPERSCRDERPGAGEERTGAIANRDVNFANQIDLF